MNNNENERNCGFDEDYVVCLKDENGRIFYEDRNRNRLYYDSITREKAIEIFRTLKNCINCIDCEECTDCADCRNSRNCVKCYGCVNTVNSTNCYFTSDVSRCDTCHSVSWQNGLKNKQRGIINGSKRIKDWFPDRLEENETVISHNEYTAERLKYDLIDFSNILQGLRISPEEYSLIEKIPNEPFSRISDRIKKLNDELKAVSDGVSGNISFYKSVHLIEKFLINGL